MPIMTGIEMCEKIKESPATSHIPVLLLTAKSGQKDKIEGLETGADDYLLKPFNAKELTLRLNNLMRTQRLLKAHYLSWLSSPTEVREQNADLRSSETQFLERLQRHMQQQTDNPDIRIADFASSLHMSERSLNRKLKSLIDRSPKQLLLKIRLDKARALLLENDLSVAKISDSCGFIDASYFSRKFKEQYNVSPKSFRKRI